MVGSVTQPPQAFKAGAQWGAVYFLSPLQQRPPYKQKLEPGAQRGTQISRLPPGMEADQGLKSDSKSWIYLCFSHLACLRSLSV